MNISAEKVCRVQEPTADRVVTQNEPKFDLLSPKAQELIKEYASRRGIDAGGLKDFLCPKLDLPSEELSGINAAVDLLLCALRNKASIMIYGDYDCDGIASMATLLQFFRDCTGTEPSWHLPDRQRDQYGLTATKAGDLFASTPFDVLVALDCGTNSHGALEFLHTNGVKTLVIDHHPLEQQAISSTVALNPNAGAQASKDQQALCTCGLVLCLCNAFAKALGAQDRWDRQFVTALSALATLADACLMTPLNRAIVKTGLVELNDPELLNRYPGIAALVREAGTTPIEQSTAQFQIIPRINALGRLAAPDPGVELLLTKDPVKAAHLASLASGFNNTRKELQQRIVNSALAQARGLLRDNPQQQLLVLADAHWHHGVVGPAASRVVEATGRSVVLLGLDSSGRWRGSGRARSTHDLGQLVRMLKVTGQILSGGGHATAVGLTLTDNQLQVLRANVMWFTMPSRATSEPETEIVGNIGDLAIGEWAMVMTLLGPFGAGNPKPLVRADGCQLVTDATELYTKEGRRWASKGDFRTSRAQTIRVLHTNEESKSELAWKRGHTVDLLLELNSTKHCGRQYHDWVSRQ